MAFVEWSMQGTVLVNCNCAFGCPCQFNALPTHGDCRAYTFFQIDQGRFGDEPLDGLRWGALFTWPGPIHLGNGTAMPIIDERANPRQRAGIEAVAHGKETDPGSLITQVFSTTLTKALPTQYKPIELTLDAKACTARIKVPGVLEGAIEPIKNATTGEVSRARVSLPGGFEYKEAEYGSGTGKTLSGEIALDFTATHAHIARVRWGTHGVAS